MSFMSHKNLYKRLLTLLAFVQRSFLLARHLSSRQTHSAVCEIRSCAAQFLPVSPCCMHTRKGVRKCINNMVLFPTYSVYVFILSSIENSIYEDKRNRKHTGGFRSTRKHYLKHTFIHLFSSLAGEVLPSFGAY